MNYGQLIDRLAEFHADPRPGIWLREADPECADGLNGFWEMMKEGCVRPGAPTIGSAFSSFEKDLFRAVAKKLDAISPDERNLRLAAMHTSRRDAVQTLGGWK